MRKTPSGLLFSPKDLLAYAEGDFVAWMERAEYEGVAPFPPDPVDPELELLKTSGNVHEEQVLAREQLTHRVTEIPRTDNAVALTRAAMLDGPDVIFQACLRRGNLQGYADFLRRVPRPSALGAFSYEPWDTKLAKTVRPYHVVQLCAYCDILEEMQGVLPARFGFVLGDGREESLRTLDHIHYYRELRDRCLEFHDRWQKDRAPDPALDRSHGRWTGAADAILTERDHLSLVANISRSQIKRLEEGGIGSFTALASGGARPASIDAGVFARLTRQARLQRASVGKERPAFEIPTPDPEAKPAGLQLLPPASSLDVFFDMEGFPHVEGGLEYLFGAVIKEEGEWRFHDWWAHDVEAERMAFEGFIDWVYARWRRDPAMHIYHYAAYETTALKRLMGKFGTREAEVDDLLRNGVFVDLYAVVRQGVAVGTPSYSLKDVEHLYRPKREGSVTTAGGSVVAYDAWRESGEPGEWTQSPKLSAIRDYNEDDCVSTGQLAEWLWARQGEAKIGWVAPEFRPSEPEAPQVAPRHAELVRQLEALGGEGSPARTLAGLLEYHRREEKPVWWQFFEWVGMTSVELIDAPDPLGGLSRTDTPPRQVKSSIAVEYSFPEQETTITERSSVRIAALDGGPVTIESFPEGARTIWLKRSAKGDPLPDQLDLIPHDLVGAAVIAESIERCAAAVAANGWSASGVTELLFKRPPVGGADRRSLLEPGEGIVAGATRIARGLRGGVLCLQGPPGAGKTYTAAHVIAALLADGKRVGVTANGHKVIDKVLDDTGRVLLEQKLVKPVLKFGGERAEGEEVTFERVTDKVVYAALKESGGSLVGATAWFFSREAVAGAFDVLVVDEAGQYPLANAVGAGQAANSLVLVGDQMQLAQPRKGTHPGQSGSSALEYYLDGHQTVPPELGILLDKTWRLNPAICGFISEAFYDGRLAGVDHLERQRLAPAHPGARIQATHGISLLDVPHTGNESASAEEIEAVRDVIGELVGREWTDSTNVRKKIELPDILVVAPFNDQVNRLERALPPGARVGTVDRFQGQEAPVVIVSMTSSTLEDAPRGAEFLLSPNRINVALSRAKALAIVVSSPLLTATRPTTVKQISLVNRLAWVRSVGQR